MFEKILKLIKSEFEYNPGNQLIVFTSFLIINLFVLGGLIILPTYNSVKQKELLLASLKSKNSIMDSTLEAFSVFEKFNLDYGVGVQKVTNSVPDTAQTSEFFVSLLPMIATAGIIPDKIELGNIEPDPTLGSLMYKIPVSIAVRGNIKDLGQMTKNIESLNRLTSVSRISFSTSSQGNAEGNGRVEVQTYFTMQQEEEYLE